MLKSSNPKISESELQSQTDAARAYDSLFVPALFGQWATVVADAAQIQPGESTLDVACGTGVLAREIAFRAVKSGQVVGLDQNSGMLAVADEHAPELQWRQGTADSLPFPDESFDRVVSQFGLMFFPKPRESIQEMLRVVKRSGRLAVAVWDSIDNISGYSAEVALIERLAGKAAADAVRAPFVLGNRQHLRSLFEDAGAASIQLETHKGVARFPSARAMVEAELRGWLPIMGVRLPEERINEILREAETELLPYTTDLGAIVFDISAHVITAEKG